MHDSICSVHKKRLITIVFNEAQVAKSDTKPTASVHSIYVLNGLSSEHSHAPPLVVSTRAFSTWPKSPQPHLRQAAAVASSIKHTGENR